MKDDVYETGATSTATARHPGSQRTDSAKPDADKLEMMKKAEAAGAPGPEHKALEQFVGNWKCRVNCWMDPNGAAEESHGTAKRSWIMEGRFLQEDFQGEMMGKGFQGRLILGFNNVKKTYQSVWFDDMSTSLFTSEGRGDSKAITLEGKSSCAATGRSDIPMKLVLRSVSADKHILEMFDGSKGNAKTMEITYTRH